MKRQKLREKLAENIFPNISFKTCMYNQMIKQSDSISKLCRDIKESLEFNQHKDFPVDRKFR
jgi:hypothetical protein